MHTIVLVHGAWHGPWCWSPVLARLDELGAPSVAVELELRDVHRDAELVTAAIEEVGGPVVLVGHSYGGLVITEAGVHPFVERLVYLCAFSPDAEEDILGLMFEHHEQSELGEAVVMQPDRTTTLDPARAPAVFYGDCSPDDVARALALLRPHGHDTGRQRPEAVAWKEKPTTYVVCGADRAVAPSLQRKLAERIPDAAVVEWPDASHSPFLSRPGDVADLLASLGA